MCGRYTLSRRHEELIRAFDIARASEALHGTGPRYNIAPGTGVVAVWDDRDREARAADILMWGLVPGWAREPEIGRRLINARAETAAQKPAFKSAMRYRRCLIPADGFFEWKRDGRAKQPYYFQVEDGRLFAFAGLWEHWMSPDGSEIRSCAVLTTEANARVARVHDRMPVIISEPDYDRWLDPALQDAKGVADLLGPIPAEVMRCYAVSSRVNGVREDGPHLIERCSAQGTLTFGEDSAD